RPPTAARWPSWCGRRSDALTPDAQGPGRACVPALGASPVASSRYACPARAVRRTVTARRCPPIACSSPDGACIVVRSRPHGGSTAVRNLRRGAVATAAAALLVGAVLQPAAHASPPPASGGSVRR